MRLSSNTVPTRTVYCCLQPLQRHRNRLLRSPVLRSFIWYTSVSPQRGQHAPVLDQRWSSRNFTAACSSAHADGSAATIADLPEATLRCPFAMIYIDRL